MACNIEYNSNGSVKEVRADDGSPSLLYQELRQQFPEQQALELFLASQSESFQIYKNKDLNKISVNNTDLKVDKKVVNGLLTYTPSIGGKRIGSFRVKGDKVDQVTIYDKFKGKGYGSSLYKYVAKDLIKQGIVLKSDSQMTQDARNVWESLVEQGVAIKNTDNTYQFNLKSVLPNGEATPQLVLSFIQEQNKTDRELSDIEIEQVNNLQMNIPDLRVTLNRVFYDNQGFFVFSPNRMNEIYTRSEIGRIISSPTIQNQIRESVEALNNTEVKETDNYYEQSELELSDTYSSFGKMLYLNPNKVRQDVLDQTAGTTKEEYDNIISELPYNKIPTTQEESTEQYSSATIQVEVEGEIKNANIEDRLFRGINLDKVTPQLRNGLRALTSKSFESLNNKRDDVNVILKSIERESAKIGLDLVGLRELPLESALDVVISLDNLMTKPTSENVVEFAQVYESNFPQNIQRSKAVNFPNNRNYVYLKTRLSETEVYKQQNLIKVGENTYIKVNDKPLETLYEIGQQYNNELTPQTVERQALQEYGGNNIEEGQKIVLLREIFGVSRPTTRAKQDLVQDNVSNYEYLSTNFVVDFNAKIVQNKLRNTPMYEMFYSNFYVDEQGGLSLKYTDDVTMQTIDRLADNDLRAYSIIDKDFPTLTQTEVVEDNPNDSNQRRDYFINNPYKAPLISTQTIIVDNNTLEIKNTSEDFLRGSDGSLWENVIQNDGRGVYKRLVNNNLNRFNTYNNPHPEIPNTNPKENYKVNNLKNRVNKELKDSEFNC